jgi:excisionase family DNA binding protein
VSDTLLSTFEVAQRFKVAPSTVSRWVKRGQLTAIRTPGGTLRFRPADVEAFLVPADPEPEAEAV